MREPKLVSVTAAEPWRLRLAYETGEASRSTLRRSWYGELRDPAYFRTVHLIDGGADSIGKGCGTPDMTKRSRCMKEARQ